MDEQAITRAAEAALGDLDLDCKVNIVRRSPDGDEWCVQFSGSYGQVCDDFKDQFGKDNGPKVVREKIKRYLLKQVIKIRNSTGKTRRPRIQSPDERKQKGSGVSEPLRFIGDALDRATQIAGEVAERASGVAVAARDAVADVAEKLTPVVIELRGVSRAKATKPSGSSKRKTTAASKAKWKGARKTTSTPKKSKKASKSTAKRGSKKRAAAKNPNARRRRSR